jgi:hypothetical protein
MISHCAGRPCNVCACSCARLDGIFLDIVESNYSVAEERILRDVCDALQAGDADHGDPEAP